MKLKTIVPELKINLIYCENIFMITDENYGKIQMLVDECVVKYSLIYPHFLITYVNCYMIDENNCKIDESSIQFTYLNEIISFTELYNNEKIYISKEKIKIIGLKEYFEELKLYPSEENETNISIIGETYREVKNNFNKKLK